MSTLLIVAIALAVLFVLLLVAARFRPQLFVPLVSLVRKSKRGKEWTDKQAIKAAAADPDALREFGKAAEPLAKAMEGKSQAEREEVLEQAVKLQSQGNTQAAADLIRQKPKTDSERRAAAKKKAARRNKKKQAKKQKKRR